MVEFDIAAGEKSNKACNISEPKGSPVKGCPDAANHRLKQDHLQQQPQQGERNEPQIQQEERGGSANAETTAAAEGRL